MNQYLLEKLIHPKHINKDLCDWINETFPDELHTARMALVQYINTEYWESKNNRINILRHQDYYSVLTKILATIATVAKDKPFPLVSILGMINIANMTTVESMTTVGEIIAVIKPAGFFRIGKLGDSYYVQSNFLLPEKLKERLELYCYLPPMTEPPNHLIHNRSSGYLSIKSDSLILGNKYNYHEYNISLDVLNTQNSNEYELDLEFISNHEKSWHRDYLSDAELAHLDQEERSKYEEDLKNWINNREQFNTLLKLIQNKTIYFTNKVDKRGRLYTQGYHFNTQGSSFEKACINLKTKETVTGEL